MADAVLTASGIEIVKVTNCPCELLEVPVAGNVEIAVGDLIVPSSGKAAVMSASSGQYDNFMGVAITANDGTMASGDVNFVTVATKVLARLTHASAPAATVYQGVGVAISAVSSHAWTFTTVTNGAEQVGWMWENGRTGETKRLALIDARAVASAGPTTAGQGFYHNPDTD